MFVSAGPTLASQSPSEAALRVTGLTLTYGTRRILNNISLTVPSGGSVAVMGRSGSGKSSLLSCILGLVKPDAGEIIIDDQRVVSGRRSRMARIRREKLGIVFQSGELLPELSATENVLIAGLLGGQPVSQARERCTKLLNQLGIPAGTRTISEFSGGERQRIAVARALMNQPRLLLADEPTGSLDPQTRDQVIDMLFEVPITYGCALVVVTHDPVVAERADHRHWLEEGTLSATTQQKAGSR